jgi:hypothetical protein
LNRDCFIGSVLCKYMESKIQVNNIIMAFLLSYYFVIGLHL